MSSLKLNGYKYTFSFDPQTRLGTLRRQDGYTVVAKMGKRILERIKKAIKQGWAFDKVMALFPKKRNVFYS